MSATQVATTVDLIIEEYPYMKTDDFKLCFKNAMKMKYGENYNRIDGSIIMGWLREYNKERCAVADNQSWNTHKAKLSGETSLQVACRMKNTGTNSNLELSKEMKKLLKR